MFTKRYTLHDELGSGGMGKVFRATDRLTGQQVALKSVYTPASQLNFNSRSDYDDLRVALTQEFRVLASLRHPNIIDVIDYGFDAQRQPYFTMALLRQPQTLIEAGEDQSREQQIEWVIELLQALFYLHRRGILHRDLKPSNVLVADGHVKVVDFGLSVRREEAQGAVGTMLYIAPEIIQTRPATDGSDLYAVGVMLYELLEGQHPYQAQSVHDFLQKLLYGDLLFAKTSRSHLEPILQRLLEKDPAKRYQDARSVIHDLNATLGRPYHIETEATRESFLQAARFVGREREFGELHEALLRAINDQGSVWLIGGESGVGKSRLMAEISTLAMVNGTLVVTGQGVMGGGLPYQLWREPLRRLALVSDLDDIDAGVLKEIVPDLETLLGRPIPDVPIVAENLAKRRLMGVIRVIFHQQTDPVLILLEDLQWTSESLDVLKEIMPVLADLPILIVGSYREDERPELPSLLPGANHLLLRRLSDESIAELSESMLGGGGRAPHIVEMLQRNTEGNVYFLVEIMRVLAEEAGELANVPFITLPKSIIAGGIQRVVERRLSRVADAARAWLDVAAVVGRQINLKIMVEIDRTVDWSAWLLECANAAVLEVVGGEWRFAHDQLREGVLRAITEAKPLYRQVAEAIEAVYPQDEDQAAILASHWRRAGDSQKELHYTLLAGKRANRQSVLTEAQALFYRALELTDDLDKQGEIYGELAGTYHGLSDFEKMKEYSHLAVEVFEKTGNRRMVARVLGTLGNFLSNFGDRAASQALYEKALPMAREVNDEEEITQLVRAVGWQHYISGDYPQAQALLEESLALARRVGKAHGISDCLNDLAGVYWSLGDMDACERLMEECIGWRRQLGDRTALANGLGNMARVEMVKRDYLKAKRYADEALHIAREGMQKVAIAVNVGALGATQYWLGEYEAAKTSLSEAVALYSTLGQKGVGKIDSMAFLGFSEYALGNHKAARDHFYAALALANELQATPNKLMVLVGFAYLATPEQAAEYVGLALNHPATHPGVREFAELLLPHLSPEDMERGKGLDLEEVLSQL